jgi:hypothetical protein
MYLLFTEIYCDMILKVVSRTCSDVPECLPVVLGVFLGEGWGWGWGLT